MPPSSFFFHRATIDSVEKIWIGPDNELPSAVKAAEYDNMTVKFLIGGRLGLSGLNAVHHRQFKFPNAKLGNPSLDIRAVTHPLTDIGVTNVLEKIGEANKSASKSYIALITTYLLVVAREHRVRIAAVRMGKGHELGIVAEEDIPSDTELPLLVGLLSASTPVKDLGKSCLSAVDIQNEEVNNQLMVGPIRLVNSICRQSKACKVCSSGCNSEYKFRNTNAGWLITTKDIKKGEELLVSYGKDYPMKCLRHV